MRKNLLIIIIILVSNIIFTVKSENNLNDIALEYISKTYNIPIEQLVIVNSAYLRLVDVKLWEAKILDNLSRTLFGITLNDAGQVVDRDLEINKEKIQQNLIYGALEAGLLNELKLKKEEDIVPVAIWLDDSGPSTNRPSDYFQYKSILKELSKKIENIEEPIINYLQLKGYKILYASKYAPLIFANVSKKEIMSLAYNSLSQNVGISKILVTRNDYKPMVNSMTRNILAQYVWARGITGYYDESTPYVAIVEADRVSNYNSYIPLAGSFNISGYIDTHASQVAGVVAGQLIHDYGMSQDFRGVAPGAYILSANSQTYYDFDIIAAIDWAVDQGARITVNSFGGPAYGPSSLVSYYDYLTFHVFLTNVISAGNYPNFGTYEVLYPGIAHNAITVGSYNDLNTPEWGDDQWSSFSCYSDHYSDFQVHGDFNKPEVSCIGEYVFSTDITGYSGETAGTSFSGPAVAGIAALLMQRQPVFTVWPEPLKAIMMVSTWHPYLNDWNHSAAGEVVAAIADDVANHRSGGYNMWTLYENNFTSNEFTLGTFDLMKGERCKVALVWDSHSNGYGNPDVLASDLDLLVEGPSNLYWSASWDNSYEYLDFIAPQSGIYTALISKSRWDQGNTYEYVGYAYSIQPSTMDYAGRDVVMSDISGVYCVYPDLAHAVATDWSALGAIYGMMINQQNIGLDSWGSWINQTTGRPIISSGKQILTIGSAWVNFAVRYYENRDHSNFWNPGTTPVYDQAYVRMNLDGVGSTNHIWFETTSRSSTPNTVISASILHLADLRGGNADEFVVQSFIDGSNREIIEVYGLGWKGSWVSTLWLKSQFSNGLLFPYLSYHWFVLKWTDSNGDLLPQINELSYVAYGD